MLTPYKVFRPLRRATRAPPWTCSPDGALPLRVLRTWAAPNVGYAQSFEKGGPKLYRPSALLTKTPGSRFRPPEG